MLPPPSEGTVSSDWRSCIRGWPLLTLLTIVVALIHGSIARGEPRTAGPCGVAVAPDCSLTSGDTRSVIEAAAAAVAISSPTPRPTAVPVRTNDGPTPVTVRVATPTVVRVATPTVVRVTKPTVVQVNSGSGTGRPVVVQVRAVEVVRVPAPAPAPQTASVAQPGPGTTAGTAWDGKIVLGDELQFTPLPASFAMIWGGGSFEIGQEYGHTPFAAGNSWYSYGTDYGLDGNQHPGLDIGTPYGTPLFSPVDGVVAIVGGAYFCNSDHLPCGTPGMGELLIRLDDGSELILGHMSSITVAEGQRVRRGDPVGASGAQNGPHLHLETRVVREGRYFMTDPRASFLLDFADAGSVPAQSSVPASGPAPGLMGGAAEGLASPPGPEWANLNRWDNEILAASQQGAVPANLIKAIMRLESDGDPDATGASGVVGLMQIYTVVWGHGPWETDNAANILKGAQILRIFYDENGQDWGEALRRYHGIGFDGYTTDIQYRDIVLGYWAQLDELSA